MRLAGAVLLAMSCGALSFRSSAGARQAGCAAEGRRRPRQRPGKTKPAKKEAKAESRQGRTRKPRVNAIAASYDAIPLAERLAIQTDLVWTGDYNGAVNGEFGERAIAAVKAFQKRNGGKETGMLNQPERAALAAAAQAEAGRGRLAHRRRPGDRRAHRHSGQARAEHAGQRRHRQLVSSRGEYSGRDVPHHAARHDAARPCSSG